jgi:alpha-tubulin suppressor-like RCC1 family protein
VVVPGITTAVSIEAGVEYACAVLVDGQVDCWGYNDDGSLGNGSYLPPSSTVPVTVPGITNATALSTGEEPNGVTCALTAGGTAKCWGADFFGSIGNGTTIAQGYSTPMTVDLSNVNDVAVGGFSVCAQVASGADYCWGYNGSGQLGNGTSSESPNPTPEPVDFGGTPTAQIVAAPTEGSATVPVVGTLSPSIAVGDPVTGEGIVPGTIIAELDGTTVTLSAAETASYSVITLTVDLVNPV